MRLIVVRPVEPTERERILTDLGLELSGSQEEPDQACFEVWMPLDLDDETVVHYVDDRPIGMHYFVVEGGLGWPQRIRQSFPIMTDEDVLERSRAASSDHERIEATYMLALVAGREVHEPILAELKASLHHSGEEVRHAAVLATGYTSWSVLEDTLVELAAKDESPRVRERAQRMLQQVAKHGWKEA